MNDEMKMKFVCQVKDLDNDETTLQILTNEEFAYKRERWRRVFGHSDGFKKIGAVVESINIDKDGGYPTLYNLVVNNTSVLFSPEEELPFGWDIVDDSSI